MRLLLKKKKKKRLLQRGKDTPLLQYHRRAMTVRGNAQLKQKQHLSFRQREILLGEIIPRSEGVMPRGVWGEERTPAGGDLPHYAPDLPLSPRPGGRFFVRERGNKRQKELAMGKPDEPVEVLLVAHTALRGRFTGRQPVFRSSGSG